MVLSCSRYGDRHRRGGASTACLSPTKQLDADGALSGALAVILSFVAEAKHVVLIHGSWGRGEQLAPARAAFEERGYTAHTPTLRYHELPMQEGAMKVASLSLRDYADDLVAFVNSLDSPPLLIGHSMGGLLAQLVAARTRQAGLVAACPGPAAGILGADPRKLAHVPAVPVTATFLDQAVAPPDRSSNFDAGSPTRRPRTSPGRYMTVWSANPGAISGNCSFRCQGFRRPRVVDFAAVTAPVLVIGAECDRIVSAGIVRRTAARYQHGTSVEIPRSDHMVFSRGGATGHYELHRRLDG